MAAGHNSTGYSSAKLVRRLRQRINQAIDATAGENEQRKRAWQQFSLEPAPGSGGARSQFQSADVNSMVTAVLAQCTIAFAGDDVVSFEANAADDEQAAKAESLAINKVLIQQNGGYSRLFDGMQDALLYRVGRIKVYWDDDIDQYILTIPDVLPGELPIVTDTEGQPGLEKRLISYDPKTKIAKVDTVNKTRVLRMSVTDPQLFFIDPDWVERELDGCPLCGEIHYMTRDELGRMGVPWAKVMDLPAVNKFADQQSSNRRRQDNRNQVEPVVLQTEIVRVFETYARLAFSESDERAYLYRCWLGDQNGQRDSGWLLEPEAISRAPYATGSAFPIAHRHEGEALAEKLYSIDAGKTEFLRQWFDNVQVNSIGRLGTVVGQVELSDVTTPVAGSPIRIKSPTAIVPIPINDVGASIVAALEYLNNDRTERGGAAVDFLSGEMQIAQDTATGTERVFAAKELLISYMMRNYAESAIKGCYVLAHATLREGRNGPIKVKIADQWTDVDPGSWQPRTQCNVNVGRSMGERMQIGNALGAAVTHYSAGLQSGLEGQLFSKSGLYKLMCDWLNMMLVDNPQGYFIDPASPQAQQAAEAAAKASQQNMQMQAQILALPEQIKAASAELVQQQKSFVDLFKTVFEGTLKADQAEMEGAVNVSRAASEAKAVQAAGAGSGGSAGTGNDRSGANGSGKRSKANGSARPAGNQPN